MLVSNLIIFIIWIILTKQPWHIHTVGRTFVIIRCTWFGLWDKVDGKNADNLWCFCWLFILLWKLIFLFIFASFIQHLAKLCGQAKDVQIVYRISNALTGERLALELIFRWIVCSYVSMENIAKVNLSMCVCFVPFNVNVYNNPVIAQSLKGFYTSVIYS